MAATKWSALAVFLPLAALAQRNDAAYCNALIERYQTNVVPMYGRGSMPPPIDGDQAVAQCKAGDTAGGIPVLEWKLRNAGFDLPKRD